MYLTFRQMHRDAQIKASLTIRSSHPILEFSFEVSHRPFKNSLIKRLLTCEA